MVRPKKKKNKNSLYLDPCLITNPTRGMDDTCSKSSTEWGRSYCPSTLLWSKDCLYQNQFRFYFLWHLSWLLSSKVSLLALTCSASIYFWLSPEAFRTWLYKKPLQLPPKGLKKSLQDLLPSLCPEPMLSFALPNFYPKFLYLNSPLFAQYLWIGQGFFSFFNKLIYLHNCKIRSI